MRGNVPKIASASLLWLKGGGSMIVYLQMIEGEEGKRQFAALYETYRGLMFYTANNILHNAQDAEDAVHQAFISLAENFSKIKTIECPQGGFR